MASAFLGQCFRGDVACIAIFRFLVERVLRIAIVLAEVELIGERGAFRSVRLVDVRQPDRACSLATGHAIVAVTPTRGGAASAAGSARRAGRRRLATTDIHALLLLACLNLR